MKRIIGLNIVLLLIFSLASFIIYAEDHNAPTSRTDEETLKKVKDEVRKLIIDGYSEHYELRNISIEEVFNDPSIKENEVLVMVSFETKSIQKSFTDFAYISGIYKALGIDKNIQDKNEMLEAIYRVNPKFPEDVATRITNLLLNSKLDIDYSTDEFNPLNVILKVTIDNYGLTYACQEIHSKTYSDLSSIFPKSYEELEKEGFDTIVDMVGADKLANHGIMPKEDTNSPIKEEDSRKGVSCYPHILILFYLVNTILFLF